MSFSSSEEEQAMLKRQVSTVSDTPQNRERDESGKGAMTQTIAQQYPNYNATAVVQNSDLDQEARKIGNKNMKAIVIAALVVVSILLVIFIVYLIWRMYKRKQRREKRRKELEEEAREANAGLSNVRPPPPVLTVRIESDSNISKTTMNSTSQSPLTPSLLEHSPITKSVSMRSPFPESSSTSSFRTSRKAVHSRPSGLSLNTTASMLTGSEKPDSCSTPMTSPNYDENAYRLSRALQSSPVVSALLSESFDTQAVRKNGKQKEGERSFDWNQCEFEKEEEAAMWIPDLQREFSQISSHNRTISEPVQIGIAADRRHALVTHEVIFGDLDGNLSPVSSTYTALSRQPSTMHLKETSSNVELLAPSQNSVSTSLYLPRSPSLVIVPYTPRTAALSRHETDKALDPLHHRNFVVMSRQRPSSADVLPKTFVSGRPQHLRTVSSAVSDSECSTQSLRRAGAMVIRNSNSSLNNMGEIVSKTRQKDTQYPPNASRSTIVSWTTNKKGKMPGSDESGSTKNENIELTRIGYGPEAVVT